MRASTLVFLSIFGFLFARAHGWKAPVSVQIHRSTNTTCTKHKSGEHGTAVRAIEEELAAVERRHRESEDSVRKLERSLRTMKDLVKKSEVDLDRTRRSSIYREAYEVRKATHAELQDEFAVVVTGYQNLLALRAKLEAQRAALEARLQLARSGLLDERDGARASPVDALSGEAFSSAY
jgi:hypothetical protein